MLSEKIKQSTSIVDVASRLTKLEKRGADHIGLCPFHNEKTPSFKVSEKDGRYKCFGCGASGTVIDLLALEQGVSVAELLSGESGRRDAASESSAFDVNKEALRIYQENLISNEEAVGIIRRRGISAGAMMELYIGLAKDDWHGVSGQLSAIYDEGDILDSGVCMRRKGDGKLFDAFRGRIVFPIFSIDKRVRGFSGRTIIDDRVKYLNTCNCETYSKGKHLYGLERAVEIREAGSVIVVEGCMDAAAVYSDGHKNVVATLGTSLTKHHCKSIKALADTVFLCFDGDEAGIKSTQDAIKNCLLNGLSVKCIVLPTGKDPSDHCASGGQFSHLLQTALEWEEWVSVFVANVDSSPYAKSNNAKTLKEYVDCIGDLILKRETGRAFERNYGLQPGDVFEVHEQRVDVVDGTEDQGDSYNESLSLPESVINPGGLISLGMDALSVPGLPKPWQYKLPVVLSTIGRAITGKIRHPQALPVFYHVIVAPSGSGKSAASEEMYQALIQYGLGDLLGPQRFASAQAIFSTLKKDGGVLLSFLDEVGGLMSSGGNTASNQIRQQAEALLELYSVAGKTSGNYRLNYSNKDRDVEVLGLLAFAFCGCTTPRCFSSISPTSLDDGLFSRVNIFYREGDVSPRGEKERENRPMESFCNKINAIVSSNKGFEDVGGADISTELVRGMLAEIDQWCADEINKDSMNDARNSFYTKVYLDSIRYALVHMASSRPIHCMTDPMEQQDLEYGHQIAVALAMWKANVLLGKVHHGDFETDWKEFLLGVRAAARKSKTGFVTRKAIADRRKRSNNWPPRRWAEIEEFLISTGRVVMKESSRGNLFALPNSTKE